MTGKLPEKLRKIRVLHNFSQEYVSEQIGVSVSSYARYESGKVEIDFYSVSKLADLYKLSLDQLVHFDEPDYNVNEIKPIYDKAYKVSITIELDGKDETLESWIKKLRDINNVI